MSYIFQLLCHAQNLEKNNMLLGFENNETIIDKTKLKQNLHSITEYKEHDCFHYYKPMHFSLPTTSLHHPLSLSAQCRVGWASEAGRWCV